MKRVNEILKHIKYNEYLNRIYIHEKQREFCKHNLEHFLNMGRISYILCLEKKININKEIIYAVALLHDIGRWVQYEVDTPHEIASAEISKEILRDCRFNKDEIKEITEGIVNHRNKDTVGLNNIFYLADKLSRECFKCNVESTCNWSKDKKNLTIVY